MINIQVVYALPNNATVIDCNVDEQTNVLQAITKSNILSLCQIKLDEHLIGIYGKRCEPTQRVKAGDRIEIYRPLINDPKEIRRRKATQKNNR
ncbi:RnfH family protein [Gilliamella sp. Pra-s65]|uniref:RnfH family protein n=1 Tax=unclassified Gilliamella TaxID=2685620 RepID=UPI00132340C8|nr:MULTISPECIES: RnfH family protein [unclassified Gilliamella]MWN31488.1 RnfH family protein [Gilliamella sp. Pra-s60]MWN89756.1 RnfH family protein [Gilliamella sp. Pra-s65]MWP29669.1 RnfH family protein [Gilliamella sp. Pra-s54]MWP47281.1 RnfH family protein [Gilliamella sp. Pas-s27]MWP72764.1 RnfH family protein [Gilliamella sp. Pra-s52]